MRNTWVRFSNTQITEIKLEGTMTNIQVKFRHNQSHLSMRLVTKMSASNHIEKYDSFFLNLLIVLNIVFKLSTVHTQD